MPIVSIDSPTIINRLLFLLSTIIIIFAPFMRSGRMYNALLILEFLGSLLILLIFWQPKLTNKIPKFTWLILFAILLIPLVYLIPLPQQLWVKLPNHSLYNESLNFLRSNTSFSPYLAASLIPYRTISTFLALLPLIGIFLATSQLKRQQVIVLVYIFLSIATLQAALGLIQYGSGADWAFLWDINDNSKNATGTYPNRDHFAALMELALPLAIALLSYNFGNSESEDDNYENKYQNLLNKTLIFLFITILLILAGVFSRSRAGVMLIIAGVFLSTLLFSRHIGGKQSVGINIILITIALGISTSIGLVPVLNRFANDPLEDSRWQIFEAVWQGLKAFYPLGSGPGTFQPVFLAFQPPALLQFINHAHNDYLELVFETGILGLILLGLLLVLYITGWINLKSNRWGRLHFIQAAAGISILLMALHGFMDFNFHTPANVIYFSFLTSIFLYKDNKKPSK